MDFLCTDAHFDLGLISIDVGAPTLLALELTVNDDDLLVQEFVLHDSILVNLVSLAMVVGTLLPLNNVMALNAYFVAANHKNAIGSTEEVSIPDEHLISDQALDTAFLIEEWAFLVNDFDLIVNLDCEVLAVSEHSTFVHRNLAVDFLESQMHQITIFIDN